MHEILVFFYAENKNLNEIEKKKNKKLQLNVIDENVSHKDIKNNLRMKVKLVLDNFEWKIL